MLKPGPGRPSSLLIKRILERIEEGAVRPVSEVENLDNPLTVYRSPTGRPRSV
jgi:hypothetical protein